MVVGLGSGWMCGCERRIEVFVKIHNSGGGGWASYRMGDWVGGGWVGGVGLGWGGGGLKKSGVGGGWWSG